MNTQYTIEQVIGMTKEILENIRVPMKEQEIRRAIESAIGNLDVCIDAIAKAKEKQAEEPAAEEPAEPGMEPLMVLKGEEAGAEEAAEE